MVVLSGEAPKASQLRSPALTAAAVCGAGFAACQSLVFWAVLVEVLGPIALEAVRFEFAASTDISRRMQKVPDESDGWIVLAEDRWNMREEGVSESVDERRTQNNLDFGEADLGDGEELEEDEGVMANLAVIEASVRFGAVIVMLVGHIMGFWCYYRCYIRDTAAKYIPQHAVTPPDMMGHWAFGTFDCFSEMGTCCCFLLCGPCSIAELWYRAGFVHGIMDPDQENPCSFCEPCPGWQYFVGGCLFIMAEGFNCTPCIGAFFRGGTRWIDAGNGGMDTQDLRQRFGIQNNGFSTFCSDCLLWACCSFCVGTQEYRQVMKLLDRGPVQVQAPAAGYTVHGNVVGAPVQVVADCATPGTVAK